MTKKVLTVIGARPQFVKASALSRQIDNISGLTKVVVHTGQHFDYNLNGIFFKQLGMKTPKYNLNINSLSHGAMTGRMMEAVESVIFKEKPDIVLVYGDTNSTLAGAIAAKKAHIRLAHVEAGLRSFNMSMPEEINRILTDRISDFLFCPTKQSIVNLKKEGLGQKHSKIVFSGDVMYDNALHFSKNSKPPEKLKTQEDFVLLTIHRAESTDDPFVLRNILSAVSDISRDKTVIFPVHPRTKKTILESSIISNADNVILIDPVGYFEILWLLNNCKLVMTDSGGLQKESYFFGKRCVVLRNETEWTELVENKCNILGGNVRKKILKAYNALIEHPPIKNTYIYGRGHASEIIARQLSQV